MDPTPRPQAVNVAPRAPIVTQYAQPPSARSRPSLRRAVLLTLGASALEMALFLILAVGSAPFELVYDPVTLGYPLDWSPATELVPFIALAPLVVYLTTLVHEGGHALAGRLVGFHFYYCRVGLV